MKNLVIFLWELSLLFGSYIGYELLFKTNLRTQDLEIVQQQIANMTAMQRRIIFTSEKAVKEYFYMRQRIEGTLEKDRIFLRSKFVENTFKENRQLTDSILQIIQLGDNISAETAYILQNTLQKSLYQLAKKDTTLKDFGYELAPTIRVPNENCQYPFSVLAFSHLKIQLLQSQYKGIERLLSKTSEPRIVFTHIIADTYSNNLVVEEGKTYEAIILVVEKFTLVNPPHFVNLRMTTVPNFPVVVNAIEGEGELLVTNNYITNGDSIKTLTGLVSFHNQHGKDTTITVSMNYKVKPSK